MKGLSAHLALVVYWHQGDVRRLFACPLSEANLPLGKVAPPLLKI